MYKNKYKFSSFIFMHLNLSFILDYSKPPPRSLMIKVTLGLVIVGGFLAFLLRRTSHKGLPSCTVDPSYYQKK